MSNTAEKTNYIQCDNETCNFVEWVDEEYNADDYIDQPCPKCGNNLLTKEDHQMSLNYELAKKMLKGMSPEMIEKMEKLGNSILMSKGIDPDLLQDEDVIDISFHNGIKMEIIKADEPKEK